MAPKIETTLLRWNVRKTIWLLAVAMGAACAGHAQKLNGAGATFPNPIYSKWFSEYGASHGGVQINYQPIGSGGGIRQVTAGTVDFGALTFNWAGGLPRVCFSFFAGVLACSWRHRLPAIDSRVILCMVLVIFMIPVQHGAAGAMVDLTAVLLLFPLLIGAASHSDPRGLPRRLCGFFGDISYPLYAIHYPIVRAICFVMNKHALPAPDRVVIGIATIIALTGGSWIIFRFYDRPARRYLTGRLLSPARSGAATVSWSAPRQPFTYRLWQLWRDTGGGVKTPETLFMRTAQSRDLRGAATGSHDTEWLHDGKIRE